MQRVLVGTYLVVCAVDGVPLIDGRSPHSRTPVLDSIACVVSAFRLRLAVEAK